MRRHFDSYGEECAYRDGYERGGGYNYYNREDEERAYIQGARDARRDRQERRDRMDAEEEQERIWWEQKEQEKQYEEHISQQIPPSPQEPLDDLPF